VADIIGARLAWTVAMISSVSEVDAGRAQVGVPELALDDVARDALAREFNRVGVAELMRREPSSDAGQSGGGIRRGLRHSTMAVRGSVRL
jgi:hypothetical protein